MIFCVFYKKKIKMEGSAIIWISKLEDQPLGGIIYNDTYFLTREAYGYEAKHFHELVHVVQWDESGMERFLTVYGIGLLTVGYRQSPPHG